MRKRISRKETLFEKENIKEGFLPKEALFEKENIKKPGLGNRISRYETLFGKNIKEGNPVRGIKVSF